MNIKEEFKIGDIVIYNNPSGKYGISAATISEYSPDGLPIITFTITKNTTYNGQKALVEPDNLINITSYIENIVKKMIKDNQNK